MINFNQKSIGALLVGFSIILIFILIFSKNSIDKQGVFLCEIVRSDPSFNMEQCPAHQNNLSWLIVAAFGISFLILGSGIYMIFMPTKIVKKEEQEFKELDISKLDEEEKKIYEVLKQNEGYVYQSDLIKKTGFSKVKITRILDKMASKRIIERQRRGMTNIVVLK